MKDGIVITEETKKALLDAYEANKEELEELRDRESIGELELGCSVSESFEQGYNNALEFVFEKLNI